MHCLNESSPVDKECVLSWTFYYAHHHTQHIVRWWKLVRSVSILMMKILLGNEESLCDNDYYERNYRSKTAFTRWTTQHILLFQSEAFLCLLFAARTGGSTNRCFHTSASFILISFATQTDTHWLTIIYLVFTVVSPLFRCRVKFLMKHWGENWKRYTWMWTTSIYGLVVWRSNL